MHAPIDRNPNHAPRIVATNASYQARPSLTVGSDLRTILDVCHPGRSLRRCIGCADSGWHDHGDGGEQREQSDAQLDGWLGYQSVVPGRRFCVRASNDSQVNQTSLLFDFLSSGTVANVTSYTLAAANTADTGLFSGFLAALQVAITPDQLRKPRGFYCRSSTVLCERNNYFRGCDVLKQLDCHHVWYESQFRSGHRL